mmetsp:Transcript_43152/g.106013  ORF Transcript_43152/g.106013 Transcript_43152/m.106013 type:complete len:436 (-) Transcript_43152:69-1376(-)
MLAFVAVIALAATSAARATAVHSLRMEPARFGNAHEARAFFGLKWPRVHPFGGKNVSVPLAGSIYPLGIYYVSIGIGSSNQQFKVAVDTGSGTLIVPGKQCDGCSETANKFDPALSTSVQKLSCSSSNECYNRCFFSHTQCEFQNTYQTCVLNHPTEPCTISGPVWRDTFTLGGLRATSTFGEITEQTKDFQQLAVIDGILGMTGSTSFGDPIPLFALQKAGQIDEPVFAFCFNGDRLRGRLMLGGADFGTVARGATFAYMPLIQSDSFVLPLNAMSVGTHSDGTTLPLPASAYQNGYLGGAILDSGTNILLVPSPVYDALHAAYSKQCAGRCAKLDQLFGGACFNLTDVQLEAYPPLTLAFDSADGGASVLIDMPPRALLVRNPAFGNQLCLGIKDTGRSGFLIIGDTTMWQYVVLLDRDKQRAGWAPANATAC